MGYLSRQTLVEMGFVHLGKEVTISDKASIYEPEKMSIGDHCRIDDFCVVSGILNMGRNIHIAAQCLVAGGDAGITFEDFSGLAYHVSVFAQSDDYNGETLTNPTVPDAYKKEQKAPVFIGRHTIVGSGAVIMPGVRIEEGNSIGALALVTKSTQPWSIYVGIPAKRVGERQRDMLKLEAEYIKAHP